MDMPKSLTLNMQDYLTTRCEGVTVLLVSHDRAFLNAVAQETVVLRDKRLEYFAGSYDAYVQVGQFYCYKSV